MTERTEKADWPGFVLSCLIAPIIVTQIVLLLCLPLCVLFPALGFFVGLAATISVWLGYTSYLILGGPLMAMAVALGLSHPVFHAVIGLGAVALLPLAHDLGIPHLADPKNMDIAYWVGPLWCAAAAFMYEKLRDFRVDVRALI